MRELVRKILKQIPPIKRILRERDEARSRLEEYSMYMPPGHFYSPIPSLEEVRKSEERLFGPAPRHIPGIELNEEAQLALLREFKKYYDEMPFQPAKTENLRYYFHNPAYAYSDAIFLYCMIRHLAPKRIIEVGSGYSSCVILDTNQVFFSDSIETVFIDPYAQELLVSLLKQGDKERITILPQRLQDVDLHLFRSLSPNDILFVDSTHVSKIGSDVNHLFFEILPCLGSRVFVHIHDIFYPFEYPKEWIYEGRAFNELYLLRAFLQYNRDFRIVFFNTFLEMFHEDWFRREMPLCLVDKGASIWLEKC